MEESDLKEIVEIFWNKKYFILILVIIFGIMGVVYTKILVTPKYTAGASMILAPGDISKGLEGDFDPEIIEGTEGITSSDVTINTNLIATYRELAKSSSVIRKVLQELENDNVGNISESSLKSQIDVTSVTGTQMIYITVTNVDPYLATTITNKLADVFCDAVKGAYKTNNISIVDYAEVPTSPSNINTTRTTIIFAGVGLILSVGIVLLINMLDNTIKTTKDIEKAVNLPVLAELPQCDFSESSSKRRRN